MIINSMSPLTMEATVVVSQEIDRGTVRARGERLGEDMLVVLETSFPGWHVGVDGISSRVVALGHFPGVEAEPGGHTYAFWF